MDEWMDGHIWLAGSLDNFHICTKYKKIECSREINSIIKMTHECGYTVYNTLYSVATMPI